jgi:hypothetical protein
MVNNIINLKYQLALFFKQKENRPDELFYKINNDLKIHKISFNEIPNIIHVPQMPIDMPIDIPIVSIKDSDNFRGLNISRSRLDYFKNIINSINRNQIDKNLDNFILEIKKLAVILEAYKKFNRFGFIAEYFIEIQDPIKFINKIFCKKTYSNLVEISFRINERMLFDNNNFNFIKNIHSGKINYDGKNKQGIILLMDFNNVPSERLFSVEKILSSIEKEKDKFRVASIKEVFNE